MATLSPRAEFGDFQTPPAFAARVCALLHALGIRPRSMLEPTCGVGNFLAAAVDHFSTLTQICAADINPAYLTAAAAQLAARQHAPPARLIAGDFFTLDWRQLIADLPPPLLILGNPPWATNSALSAHGSANLPAKHNRDNRAGLAALTGDSNFDLAEAVIRQLLDQAAGRAAIVAMLCKTSVARRLLARQWAAGGTVGRARLFAFDARAVFDVAVDACLLLLETGVPAAEPRCDVYDDLDPAAPRRTFGWHDAQLVADSDAWARWQTLAARGADDPHYRWRSGLKHDCAPVMEFTRDGDALINKLGERWQLEETCLFPLIKGAQLARSGDVETPGWVLVTQRSVGAPTAPLARHAPRTWAYLLAHADQLDARKSTIYRNRPRFAIFGIGDYAFAPWKVAIAGLYKALSFRVVGPYAGKPVMLDDTCYYLACQSEAEARLLAELLHSAPAQAFLQALIFWDAKRPITAGVLRRLDLARVAREVGRLAELMQYTAPTAAQQRMPF